MHPDISRLFVLLAHGLQQVKLLAAVFLKQRVELGELLRIVDTVQRLHLLSHRRLHLLPLLLCLSRRPAERQQVGGRHARNQRLVTGNATKDHNLCTERRRVSTEGRRGGGGH